MSAINVAIKMLKSRLFYALLIGALIIYAFAAAVDGVSSQTDDKQVEFLQNAVRRCAVQCYAIEGCFPDDIQYLEENYTLIIDRSRYNAYYEYMGGNLIPQIWIVPVKQGKS